MTTPRCPTRLPNLMLAALVAMLACLTARAQANDIGLTLRATKAAPVHGESVQITLDASNRGSVAVTAITVKISIPSGLTLLTAIGGGVYQINSSEWTVDKLAPGATASLVLSMQVLSSGSYGISVVRTASTPADTVAANDRAVLALTPIASVRDLGVALSVDNPNPVTGTTVTFTARASNVGTQVAPVNVVADFIPASCLVFVSASGTGSYDPATRRWNAGSLATGQTVSLTMVFSVQPPAGACTLQISVNDVLDPNDVNDRITVGLNPQTPTTDLALRARIDNPVPTVGDNVVFTLTARNMGPIVTMGDIVINFPLPAGYRFVSSSDSARYDAASGVWRPSNLPPGTEAVLTVTATVQATGSYVGTASLRTSLPADTNAVNNVASVAPNPVGAPLDIEVRMDPGSYYVSSAGEVQQFTVRVRNISARANAADVAILIDLPADYFTYLSYVATRGTYVPRNGVWSIGMLAANQQVELVLSARAKNPTATRVSARLYASTPLDVNSANNTGESTGAQQVVVGADAKVTVSASPAIPTAGQSMTLTVRAINDSNTHLTGATVRINFPNGLQFQRAVTAEGSYSPQTGIWQIGSLQKLTTAELRLEVMVLPPVSYRVDALVNANEADTQPQNNQVSISVTPR